MQRCFLRVLSPVKRPVTVPDFVALKENSPVLAASLEINSGSCFCYYCVNRIYIEIIAMISLVLSMMIMLKMIKTRCNNKKTDKLPE
jgi:hypothetical protein